MQSNVMLSGCGCGCTSNMQAYASFAASEARSACAAAQFVPCSSRGLSDTSDNGAESEVSENSKDKGWSINSGLSIMVVALCPGEGWWLKPL